MNATNQLDAVSQREVATSITEEPANRRPRRFPTGEVIRHAKEERSADAPMSETTRVHQKVCRVLSIDTLDFHLFKPRTSRHPLLRAAYELWRTEWLATLGELEGITRLHSDEFNRLDEVGVLSIGQRCISLIGLRWLDLSLPMAREDSYFQHWPDDVMQRISQRIVSITSNVVVHSDWRRAIIDPSAERSGAPATVALTTVTLGFRRCMESPAEHVIAVTRNDRAMNRTAANAGAVTIGQIQVHGIDSDIILVTRDNAKTRGAVYDVLWSRRWQEQPSLVP